MNKAIKQFDATEANLVKAEKLFAEMMDAVSKGLCFADGEDPEYASRRRSLQQIIKALPAIDGWKMPDETMSLSEIAMARFDANEIDDIGCRIGVEEGVRKQEDTLAEYRCRFERTRRELVRDRVKELIREIDELLGVLAKALECLKDEHVDQVELAEWQTLTESVDQLDVLLGSTCPRKGRWNDMQRHLHFGEWCDLNDILEHDWPDVKQWVVESLYGEADPIPVACDDLSSLVASKPTGDICTKLEWDKLDASDFERLVFNIVSNTPGYENAKWLMHTNAPDQGRDLSVQRVASDPLSGIVRCRVIIQCKHWLSKGVGLAEFTTLKEQMKLWEPPRVDVYIIVTSGRFTSDAVRAIEKHNVSDSALRIEMWPDSHLESILASRPDLVAQFGLRPD